MVKFCSIGVYLVVFSIILGACVAPAAAGVFIIPLVGAKLLSIINVGAGFLVSVIALKDYAVQWITPNITKQELREADISQFSLNIEGFRDVIRDLRKGIQFDNQMSDFAGSIGKIDRLFKDYSDISPFFDPTLSRQKNFPNYIYLNFQLKVLNSQDISEILYSLLNTIAPIYTIQVGLADIFFDQMKNFNDVCRIKLSQMQRLNELFGLITLTEQKAFQVLKFAHRVGEWTGRDTEKPYVENKTPAGFTRDLNNLMTRFSSCVKRFVELFAVASTEIQSCDPVGGHVKDVTYTELKDVFQQYIISEASVYKIGECPQNCSRLNNRMFRKLLDHEQTNKFTFVQDTYKCNEYLKECKILNDDYLGHICISKAQDRRYDFAIFKKNDTRQCSGKLKAGERINRRNLFGRRPAIEEYPTCPQCECMCVNGRPGGNMKYFSLTKSSSNTSDNYVVTGIRFRRKDDTILLEIQEGQVLPYGGVDANTLRWQNSTIEKNNRVPITYDVRKIALDKLMVPDNHVVTSVKLETDQDILRLRVFYNEYDRISGKILPFEQSNYKPDNTFREEVQQLDYKKLAINSDQPNNEISGYGKFVSFRSSDLEQDGGQTTVPLIDIQNVTSDIPTPLSGIGITHRRNMESSGFLGLSIFTFNIVAEISEEKLQLGST